MTIIIVLSNYIDLDEIYTPLQRKKWLYSYLESLNQYELFVESAEIINSCSDDDIRQSNQKSTTFYLNCGSCGKPSNELSPLALCERCFKPMNNCAICEQLVKGIYTWCQICGHGGHINCMMEWFKDHENCPKCLYKFKKENKD